MNDRSHGTEADRSRPAWLGAAGRHFGGPARIERLKPGIGRRLAPDLELRCGGGRRAPRPDLAARSADRPAPRASADARARHRPRDRVSRAARRLHRPACARRKCCSSSPRRMGWAKASSCACRGTAIARKLLRDPPYDEARTRIAGQLGEILARIHAVDPANLPPLGPSRGRRPHRRHAPRPRRLEPAATGVRTGADLARPAQAAADRPADRWCTATTAPATISLTRAA